MVRLDYLDRAELIVVEWVHAGGGLRLGQRESLDWRGRSLQLQTLGDTDLLEVCWLSLVINFDLFYWTEDRNMGF